MAEFTLPQLPVVPEDRGGGMAGGTCDAVDAAVISLSVASDETQVAAAVTRIQAAQDGCSEADVLTAAAKAIHSTVRESSLFPPLRAGEIGTLTLTRVDAGGATETWVRRLVAPARGRWLTSFGFNFLEQDDDEYTTQDVPDQQGKYTIKKSAPSDGLQFKPAVFFTWVPNSWDRTFASFGLTGGLDFDGTSISLFAGPSAYVGDNLHLSLGVAVRQVTRLRGEYFDGQTVNQQLVPDQLTRQTYQAGVFVGLGFRFDKSPFAKTAVGEGTEANSGSAKP